MIDAGTPISIAAGGAALTLFGVATGLEPAVLIAGFIGALWAQTYSDPMPAWKRVLLTLLVAVIAGYLAPALAAVVLSTELGQKAFTMATLQLPIAVIVGLVSHRVLGPAIMKLAAKRVEDLGK